MHLHLRIDPLAQEIQQTDQQRPRPSIQRGLVHLVQHQIDKAGDEAGDHHAAGEPSHQTTDGAVPAHRDQREP